MENLFLISIILLGTIVVLFILKLVLMYIKLKKAQKSNKTLILFSILMFIFMLLLSIKQKKSKKN